MAARLSFYLISSLLGATAFTSIKANSATNCDELLFHKMAHTKSLVLLNREDSFIRSRNSDSTLPTGIDIETAGALRFKYALLLDAEVEQVPSIDLLTSIDQWMGTPYRMGGTTKAGIDCSGFVQTIYAAVYKINIPRTSKDQYNFCHAIPYDELKTGDLVFFNTTGGVSHVGIYLQNNKFVHAFSSGVNISDLNDEYYAKRFIGAGRIDH